MNRILALSLLGALVFLAASADAANPPEGMVLVRGGTHRPLYRSATEPASVQVNSFYLDVHAITNDQYLAFVRANPDWRRTRARRLFADEGYLRHWSGDLSFDPAVAQAPVVYVSWFAARAYAAWAGKRLPTTAEWELAASASETRTDGRGDAAYNRRLLSWYSRPRPAVTPPVRSTYRNVWGAWDLHGLVWEWVEDFNAVLTTSDSRSNRDSNARLFCSGAAVGAGDFEDYAAFLRYAYRGGVQARFTTPNLGFRLAKNVR
jgi:formylglycine-generating enzyme